MAYDFEFSDAADRIQFPSNADYTTTVSVSLWVNAESNPGTNQTNYLIKHKSGGNTDKNFAITWTPAGGGDVYILFDDGGGVNEWRIDFTPTTGTWTHFYFSIDWTTNPDTVRVWVDNVEQTVTHNFGSNNITPLTTATQVYSIGGPAAGDPNFTDGLIAEIGVWSDLDPSRVTPLSKGFSPHFFPINRKECIHLVRELINCHGGTGTLNGTPVVADHPRIIYPSNYNIAPFTAAGAVITPQGIFLTTNSFWGS